MTTTIGSPRASATEPAARTSRYRAPALEKGLDVIELLAAEKSPLNLSAISQRLGRSSGELFRMLQVLEFKGFITTAESGSGYVLTNKLFALAMAQAPVRSLVETALPIMRKLAHDIGQSCHITVASEDQIVVITRIERPGDLGFSVRIGYRREIIARHFRPGAVRLSERRDAARLAEALPAQGRGRRCVRGARECGARARASRGGVRFRARHRRLVGAHPARRNRGRGAHLPLRAQQSAGHGNAAVRGMHARRGAADIRRDRARGSAMTESQPHGNKPEFITPGFIGATVLVVALFAFWGMSNSLNDVLIPQFRKTFLLGDFASSFVQFATFIGYFVFAIPASLFMRRFGYRAAVVMGLVLFGTRRAALLSGRAIRRVPLLPRRAVRGGERPVVPRDLRQSHDRGHGPAGKRRPAPELRAGLQPARHHCRRVPRQGTDPLGSSPDGRTDPRHGTRRAGGLARRRARRRQTTLPRHRLRGAAVGAAGGASRNSRRWRDASRRTPMPPRGGFRGLLAFPRYWLGVFAQFAYVGAQVGVWSFVIRYTQFNTPGTAEKVAANNLLITLTLFFAGRFIGTLLMSKFRPALLLAIFSAVDVALCVVAAIAGGDLGLYALMATSFFMSIQFPTIFTMSLRGLGNHTKSGSSFLVMAIVGGAVIPPLMGLVSDASTINTAMLVPALCFAVVLLFAWKSRRDEVPAAALTAAA